MSEAGLAQIRKRRLKNDHDKVLQLAARSAVLSVVLVRGVPPHTYVFGYDCPVFVREASGSVHTTRGCLVAVYLPPRYPRLMPPLAVALHPALWHPNIVAHGPICTGVATPGYPLDSYLYRIYHILTYRNFTMNEGSSLNPRAAAWARANADRGWFPTTHRPLADVAASEAGI